LDRACAWPFDRALVLSKVAKRCLESIVQSRSTVQDVLVELEELAGRHVQRAGAGQEYCPHTGQLIDVKKKAKKGSFFGRGQS